MEAADVMLRGPMIEDDKSVHTPVVVDVDQGIEFNGVGDDSHELFVLSEYKHHEFVKTLQKPYDTPVACILLRAYHLAPDNVELWSDGRWDQKEWMRARGLYQSLWPGEPLRNPGLDEAVAIPNSTNGGSVAPMSSVSSPIIDMVNRLEKLKLESASLLKLGSVKSTVSSVDFSHVRYWLSRCDPVPAIQWQTLPGVQFRVIDIRKRCVVEANPESCPFMILTYVWGGIGQPKLTSDTVSLLSREGGLTEIWPKIPTTVRDAITVCERLGESYLWVDALCIMQDSVVDMKIQILRMRQIYSAAKCAIAAVSAETAEVGLLGTLSPTNSQPCDSVDDLNTLVDASPWSTRAWCYQEKVLSHRAILFTSRGIYMQDRQSTCNSATGKLLTTTALSQTSLASQYNSVGGILYLPPGCDLLSFLFAVEHYSHRQLTNSSDKLSAFQGILHLYRGKMDDHQSSFCFGLPVHAFDQVFCWRTTGLNGGLHYPHLRNRAFPSWSWLGWDAPVDFSTTRQLLLPNNKNSTNTNAAMICTSHLIHPVSDNRLGGRPTPPPGIRKPVPYPFSNVDPLRNFGFPISGGGGMYYNSNERHIAASYADLSISTIPIKQAGTNGLYPVFPLWCAAHPRPPVERWSVYDAFTKPMPVAKVMDRDTERAESVVAARADVKSQFGEEYDLGVHEGCVEEECEAKRALGYIWLDREWRAAQGEYCVKGFIPVAGEYVPNSAASTDSSGGDSHLQDGEKGCTDQGTQTDDEKAKENGKWTVTMLLCMQFMAKNGHVWARERVQVMDCEIGEDEWLRRTRAEIKNFTLV
ncbi:heterokaryon incompatibility protein-domain-containing protein [Bombardia bombarda]|uniref:Heterokaryon incompatibility protein-domain-containing protein n=1 Tax=Bombardia bombarda TaxID=252184 RepID=A0AA40CA14_9PEZI|nr:heterokaryon incompatibility protein-domain-containing protein [Bombardia bombarda]